MSKRKFRNNTTILDRDGNFIDWKNEYKKKNEYLNTYYEEEVPTDFLREVLPQEYLDTYMSKTEVGQKSILGESEHTGRGTGLVKRTVAVNEAGKPKVVSFPVYNDYNATELCFGNRFALINLCTYFGKGKNRIPSICFGLAIDLDYVRLNELEYLFGMIESDEIPTPTYLVNSGAGIHLYYLFEQPVPLKDTAVQAYLTKMKYQLTCKAWNYYTSLDEDIQYQGIYQDMRIPGSWSKLGYANKYRCSYIIKAFKTGKRVDLTHLAGYCDVLGNIEDYASLSTTPKISLAEAKEKYPDWFRRVVEEGQEKGYYVQSRGLYEWWRRIITAPTPTNGDEQTRTSREGNRFYCISVLFVMAFKCGMPLEEVTQDALSLIDFMNTREHHPNNDFTEYDVMCATIFYSSKYVRWGNRGVSKHCTILLPPSTSRRNGRSQTEHLKRAGILRKLSSYENNGRPSVEHIVKEWREKNPDGKKAQCVKETRLSKPTVLKWWSA